VTLLSLWHSAVQAADDGNYNEFIAPLALQVANTHLRCPLAPVMEEDMYFIWQLLRITRGVAMCLLVILRLVFGERG
jgi:hypothetical protein